MNSGYYTSVAQLPRDFQPLKKKLILRDFCQFMAPLTGMMERGKDEGDARPAVCQHGQAGLAKGPQMREGCWAQQ